MKLIDEIDKHIAQMPQFDVGEVWVGRHVEARKTVQLLKQACDELEKCKDLLREVCANHSDERSSDYNECDANPCNWCKEAWEILE